MVGYKMWRNETENNRVAWYASIKVIRVYIDVSSDY